MHTKVDVELNQLLHASYGSVYFFCKSDHNFFFFFFECLCAGSLIRHYNCVTLHEGWYLPSVTSNDFPVFILFVVTGCLAKKLAQSCLFAWVSCKFLL